MYITYLSKLLEYSNDNDLGIGISPFSGRWKANPPQITPANPRKSSGMGSAECRIWRMKGIKIPPSLVAIVQHANATELK